MGMIITIGGTPGSGKSTISRMLAERLRIPFVSMGQLQREYAASKGLTIEQLNELYEEDFSHNFKIDEYQKNIAKKHETFIIDSRLGFFIFPQSIKVFLTVPPSVGADRVYARKHVAEHWHSVAEAAIALAERAEYERRNYLEHYGVDILDMSKYDLILDSSTLTPEEILQKILQYVKSHPKSL
jgi:CMP/dCMP kinase